MFSHLYITAKHFDFSKRKISALSANLKADRSSKTGKIDFIVSQVHEEQDLEFYVWSAEWRAK